jgi:hypothetical protein
MSAQFMAFAYHKTAGVKILTDEIWKNIFKHLLCSIYVHMAV